MSSPGEGRRSCGGEVWCRDFLFPAFQGFLQCGIGGSDERLLRCSTLPLTKNTLSGHLLYNCFMDNQQGLLLYPNPADLNCERSQLILPSVWLGSLTLFCFAQIVPCTLSNLFWAKCVCFSERHNRIGLLEQLYCRAPRALLIPGCITVYTKCF